MSASLILVIAPATADLIAEVPDEGVDGVAAAVDATRASAPAWALRPLSERVLALKKWRDAVLDEKSEEVCTRVAESPR